MRKAWGAAREAAPRFLGKEIGFREKQKPLPHREGAEEKEIDKILYSFIK